MQNKNELDDMTQKYKEEMMRLYSRNRSTAVQPARQTQQAKQAQQVKPARTEKAETPVKLPERDLSKPPMPEIPKDYAPKQAVKEKAAEKASTPKESRAETEQPAPPKFPAAEELMRSETAPASRFEPAEYDEPVHNQGNYDFQSYPEKSEEKIGGGETGESYPDGDTDFSAVDPNEDFPEDNPPDMSGQGYLQIEVTTASGAIPVRDAAVIVTESLNGKDSLIGMSATDENGATPIIALSAPPKSLSEAPDPSERPYSEYNIGVYKKGFYIIPRLTVPVFDTIKSIQPVSVIPLAEFDLNGTVLPGDNR